MKIYFLGICGTAMGNAALLARAAGHEVSGADSGVYPPMSTVLAEAGIAVHAGYDAGRLARLAPDLVVIGNALSRGNPEVEWLLEARALAFTSLPELLHDTILRRRRNVVVCGTHGKTTTTALCAFLLRAAGADPGFLIGGVPQDPPCGSHLGQPSAPFVIEGDEYDSAFFDKRSKFIHYAPHVAVLNNLEFDHADIFRDLADIQRSFTHLTRLVPRNGWIVLNGDDPNLAALGPTPWTRQVRVGCGADNDVLLSDFAETPSGASFRLAWRGRPWARVEWGLNGEFNARNAAMAATAAALALRPEDPAAFSLGALAAFRGVRRRQEVRLDAPGLTVIEDFGHHPTALAATLDSLRARHPDARLTAVFEARSNTARTKRMQAAFTGALARADAAFIGPVSRAERLSPAERFAPEEVVADLVARGRAAVTAPTNAELLAQLRVRNRPDGARREVVVFFTNGSFDGIIEDFVAASRRGA
ncbi:MAG: UDP-N-acetylmuramate:L-alanyl-gamma-D-glutamyl-meso-diaminopimelate ligase [Opitutaceae bacterium]